MQILWPGRQRKACRAAAGIQISQEIRSPDVDPWLASNLCNVAIICTLRNYLYEPLNRKLTIYNSHNFAGSSGSQEGAHPQQAHDEDPRARQEERPARRRAHRAPRRHLPPEVAVPLSRGAGHGGSQKWVTTQLPFIPQCDFAEQNTRWPNTLCRRLSKLIHWKSVIVTPLITAKIVTITDCSYIRLYSLEPNLTKCKTKIEIQVWWVF